MRLAAARADWALGFADETWWSRLARPKLHSWSEDKRNLQLVEQAAPDQDPDPKALACYGLWLPALGAGEMLLRFVDGRPVSAITTQFLAWCCARLEERGTRVVVWVWDNAGWHISKRVRQWIQDHNWGVKQAGRGVRILVHYLPSRSPWLNPIEPKWLHAKRRVVEPARLLSSKQVAQRVCDTFGIAYEAHLAIPDNVP